MAPPAGGMSSRCMLRSLLAALLAVHWRHHHLSQRALRGRRAVRTEAAALHRRSRTSTQPCRHASASTECELGGCVPDSDISPAHVYMDVIFTGLLPVHGSAAVVAKQSARGLPVAPQGSGEETTRPSRHALRPHDARLPVGAPKARVRRIPDEASLLPHPLGAVGLAATGAFRCSSASPGSGHRNLRRVARIRR